MPRRAGRSPRRDADLARLRQELERAVAEERYEQAAQIRDRIRTLEAEPEGNPGD
jgi:protein arginine kinase activator